jgi:hypothetical protein
MKTNLFGTTVTQGAVETLTQYINQAREESLRSHLIFLAKNGEIRMVSGGDYAMHEASATYAAEIDDRLDRQAAEMSGGSYAGILGFTFGLTTTYGKTNDIGGLDDLGGMLEAALKRLKKLLKDMYLLADPAKPLQALRV